MHPLSIVWFNQDLRLADNPALTAALEQSECVIPIYIHSAKAETAWPLGGASRWWLHYALSDLQAQLQSLGTDLWIVQGTPETALAQIVEETGATALYLNQPTGVEALQTLQAVQASLELAGVNVHVSRSSLLFDPRLILNKAGKPFQVFTAFWRQCLTLGLPANPLPSPKQFPAVSAMLRKKLEKFCCSLASLELLPKIPWDAGLKASWDPSTKGAHYYLQQFVQYAIGDYTQQRNVPAASGTSRLSPYLHFGQISPREIVNAVLQANIHLGASALPGVETFLKELGWREFAYYLLYYFPHTDVEPLKPEFKHFPWTDNPILLKQWQKGLTGYPIVDAGMRELWHTGWMHNRVRMIVASFLVKDLHISWQTGAQWFWDTLVDADLASNSLGWQWVSGCGADAAPFFRVFNPVLQGEKFDPQGDYVCRWIPELSRLPKPWIHKPWEAPPLILLEAGLVLEEHYPYPIVDHFVEKKNALAAFNAHRKRKIEDHSTV